MSFEDHNEIPDMEIEGEESTVREPSTAGSKRDETEPPRSFDLPKKPCKRMPPRSKVLEHFTRTVEDYKQCKCHYCGQLLNCDSATVGTSSMKGHIGRCKLFKIAQEGSSQQVLSSDCSGNLKAIKYDPELFTRSVNEMIVLNELPFSFVESEGFRRFCFNVVPVYKHISRRTSTKEIAAMYLQKKECLKKLFTVEKKRVSLTTDIWTAPTTSYSYMVVTAHWIDTNWKMQKRIISFKPITDHRGATIAAQLLECLDEWGIEKIFTITVDNASGNTSALKIVRDVLRLRGTDMLIQDGAFMHMRCCSHILNLIVRDGMEHVNQSVVAVRNAVKYVRSSYARLKSFELRVETGKINRGSLALDCTTRWNSTYLMLTSALKLKVAFEKMMVEDKLYVDYFLEKEESDKSDKSGNKRIGPPTSSDWDEVQRLVKFLKIFHKCTLAFSASTSVTSTICYNEICIIERNLISLSSNIDKTVRTKAASMREKFDKYWDGLSNMNGLVIAASVFDPRNKMQFASLCFEKLYGKDSVEGCQVMNLLRNLYEEYNTLLKPVVDDNAASLNTSVHGIPEQSSFQFEFSDDEDGYERMDHLYNQMVSEKGTEEGSSELQIYLMEKVEPRVTNNLGLDYDILSWWKHNSLKYPVLAEVARDVLAIQVSTVASESAFSTSGRILDPYRSSLTPFMIETLICTQQWLKTSVKAEANLGTITQMIEELEFHESLDSRKQTQSDH